MSRAFTRQAPVPRNRRDRLWYHLGMSLIVPQFPKTRRWTVDEYYRLADHGFFIDQRVELIAGRIIEMAPQKDPHAVAILLGHQALSGAFGEGYVVRCRLPLHLSSNSEPEPDFAVLAGGPRDFLGKGHPRTALLVVEISDTTLRYDRRKKAGLYAKAGIEDYWIVNLIDRQLEVHRKPVADRGHPFGHRYADVSFVGGSDAVIPLAIPVAVAAADLLP